MAQVIPAVDPNGKDEIQLDVSDARGTNIDAASLVIDAAGFMSDSADKMVLRTVYLPRDLDEQLRLIAFR